MPFPLTPPPTSDYGAFTIPRILQRWLDVNPIGPLTRTQGYITLPAFSQSVTWQGYSDIVVAFNYEGPNNFTLFGFNVEPFPLPNYCLCIAWKDEYGNMNRYSLWRGVGEVIYLDIPVYSGQKIAKNFRFEIWSTNVATVSQATSIQIYTSVLGGVDYRWGVDFQLVGNDTQCTAFGENIIPNGPNIIPAGSVYSSTLQPVISTYFYNLPTLNAGSVYHVNLLANDVGLWYQLGNDYVAVLGGSGSFTSVSSSAIYILLSENPSVSVTAKVTESNYFPLPLIFPSNSSPTINTI